MGKLKRAYGKLAIGRVAVIGIVVAIIVIGGLAGLSLSTPSNNSTSPSATSTAVVTSHAATSSSRKSSTSSQSSSSSSNSPLAISVIDTVVDVPDASQGNTLYIYNVSLTDNSKSNQYYVDTLYFTLITNTNSKYSASLFTPVGSELSAVSLSQGQNTAGDVAFQIPNGQKPSTLDYKAVSSPIACQSCSGISETISKLPAPSVWVSMIDLSSTPAVTGTSNLLADITLQNSSTSEFLTGQIISVQMSLTNVGQNSITVSSITLSNHGFKVSSISPSLPVTVSPTGSGTNVVVNIVAPSSSYNGALNFTIAASGG